MTRQSDRVSAVLKDVGRKAASAFGEAAGKAFVEKLWQLSGGWIATNPDQGLPTVSALAVRSYLRGGAFSIPVREQVVAWAMWELEQLDHNEAEIVLRSAAMRGDTVSAVDAVVAHFARVRLGVAL